jgi:hypothetical protein
MIWGEMLAALPLIQKKDLSAEDMRKRSTNVLDIFMYPRKSLSYCKFAERLDGHLEDLWQAYVCRPSGRNYALVQEHFQGQQQAIRV